MSTNQHCSNCSCAPKPVVAEFQYWVGPKTWVRETTHDACVSRKDYGLLQDALDQMRSNWTTQLSLNQGAVNENDKLKKMNLNLTQEALGLRLDRANLQRENAELSRVATLRQGRIEELSRDAKLDAAENKLLRERLAQETEATRTSLDILGTLEYVELRRLWEGQRLTIARMQDAFRAIATRAKDEIAP